MIGQHVFLDGSEQTFLSAKQMLKSEMKSADRSIQAHDANMYVSTHIVGIRDTATPFARYTESEVGSHCSVKQSMKWIELKRSSPVQIHESLILIQSNPADDPEAESSPVQSGHYRVDIYQIPCKIYM